MLGDTIDASSRTTGPAISSSPVEVRAKLRASENFSKAYLLWGDLRIQAPSLPAPHSNVTRDRRVGNRRDEPVRQRARPGGHGGGGAHAPRLAAGSGRTAR